MAHEILLILISLSRETYQFDAFLFILYFFLFFLKFFLSNVKGNFFHNENYYVNGHEKSIELGNKVHGLF